MLFKSISIIVFVSLVLFRLCLCWVLKPLSWLAGQSTIFPTCWHTCHPSANQDTINPAGPWTRKSVGVMQEIKKERKNDRKRAFEFYFFCSFLRLVVVVGRWQSRLTAFFPVFFCQCLWLWKVIGTGNKETKKAASTWRLKKMRRLGQNGSGWEWADAASRQQTSLICYFWTLFNATTQH